MGLPAASLRSAPDRPPTPVAGPLFVSLAFHALFFSTLPLYYEGNVTDLSGTTARPPERIMRVRFPELPTEGPPPARIDPEGQVVDLLDTQTYSSKAPADSRFLSERNRIVERERQARLTGPHPNAAAAAPGGSQVRRGGAPRERAAGGQGAPPARKPRAKEGPNLRLPESYLQDAAAAARGGGKLPGGERLASIAPSNYLPGIEMGNETLLNTREYVYSSFFVRMKRQMEGVWNPRPYVYSGRLPRDRYVTVVGIVLERDGRVREARVVESSGSRELDREALRAVNGAGPYLNPPVGLTDADGLIQIPHWHFIVTLRGLL